MHERTVHVEKDFLYVLPSRLYVLMLQFMFLWLFRKTFVRCLFALPSLFQRLTWKSIFLGFVLCAVLSLWKTLICSFGIFLSASLGVEG